MYQPTEEQKEARKVLMKAVDDYVACHGDGEGLLMDWVLCTARHIVEADGHTSTSVHFFTSPELPMYRLMGLVGFVDQTIRADLIRRG